jgi:fructose-1,6-bisphosphatase/inositol monophosphatase family enzyme
MTKMNGIELRALTGFREGSALQTTGNTREDTAVFALRACLEAGRLIRPARLTISMEQAHHKADGSPATALELAVEDMCRDLLASVLPDAKLLGEESGGDWSDSGIVVTIDPIDGTWAFLTGTETFSTALAVFQDGKPIAAAIASPVTGEIGYATSTGSARLIQMGLFGTSDAVSSLPLVTSDSNPILVNLHPSRAVASTTEVLHRAWNAGSIRQVRSPGGSPSWALLEATRGNFTYVNLWSSRPSEPWDLAAGSLILRQAGGEIVDVDNNPIDALSHSGPLIASMSAASRSQISAQVREALLSQT